MAVKTKPNVGETIIINEKYFNQNALITQYFQNLKPGLPYEILKISELSDSLWGISIIKSVETGEIFDISNILEGRYWCLLDQYDSYRVIK